MAIWKGRARGMLEGSYLSAGPRTSGDFPPEELVEVAGEEASEPHS